MSPVLSAFSVCFALALEGLAGPTGDAGRASVSCTGNVRVPLSAALAFPLFEPEGERRWAQGWSPEYLSSATRDPAPGLVFRTGSKEEQTLWMMASYDPDGRTVSYVNHRPGYRTALIEVRCIPETDASTVVQVSYVMTALSSGADAEVRTFAREYDTFLAHWEHSIQRHVIEGVPMGRDHDTEHK